jgi:hypothetical protein
MLGAAIVYIGFVVAVFGLALVVRPMALLRISKRSHGLIVAAFGLVVACIGMALPAPDVRIGTVETRLDEFAPAWQFRERHTIKIAAPPSRVFVAIRRVRADEIAFFRLLTWIRRAGRPLPQSILNAGTRESLMDVATRTGFVRLADDDPREVVIGTVVIAPPGIREALTPDMFQKQLPPGFALATMNFLVAPDGPDGSFVSTETRVFANSVSSRRRFAAYWRLIYPGSAIIRRMWLRAIERRATE